MGEESKGIGDALTSLGATLTSPAKLAFVGYVVLVYKGALGGVSFWKFVVISGLFIFIQIGHDGYLRIVLNRLAQGKPTRN